MLQSIQYLQITRKKLTTSRRNPLTYPVVSPWRLSGPFPIHPLENKTTRSFHPWYSCTVPFMVLGAGPKVFPLFTSLGYHFAAVNWHGTGGTFAGGGVKKVKMDEHVQDLSAFLEEFVPKLASSSTKKELKPIYSHKPLLWWLIHYEIWNIWKNTRRRVWTI